MNLPYQRHSTTSKEAAESNVTALGIRDRTLRMIRSAGARGMIADEVALLLNKSPNAIASRFKELEDRRIIVKLAERRKTRAKRDANVYVISGLQGEREVLPPKGKTDSEKSGLLAKALERMMWKNYEDVKDKMTLHDFNQRDYVVQACEAIREYRGQKPVDF